MCRFKSRLEGIKQLVGEFQYILCVGSSRSSVFAFKAKAVSIHPMCRFKKYFPSNLFAAKQVSIHPMCRFKPDAKMKGWAEISFNTSYVSVQVF